MIRMASIGVARILLQGTWGHCGGTRRRGVVMSLGALKGARSGQRVQPLSHQISEFFRPEMIIF